MTQIFISYRRSDSEADTWRLVEHLGKTFQESEIFFDHQSIEPGDDFSAAIDKALEKANVMLVVINKNWLDAKSDSGIRRLDQSEDYVRREIKSALDKGITLIPLLIEGTLMPEEKDMPDELKRFVKRQGVSLSRKRFSDDINRLAEKIKKYVPVSVAALPRDFSQEILSDYHEKNTLSMGDENYTLRLHYTSDTAPSTLCGSHHLTEAIEHLIEEAGIGWWVKHEDELSPEEFWVRILKSVIISCRIGYTGESLDDYSDADIIRWFLPELEGIDSLWLKSDAYKISQRVVDAFPDAPPPIVSKMTSEYFDDDPEMLKVFQGRRWTSITHEQAEQFDHSLMIFSPAIAKVYLPAFLTAALKKRGDLGRTIFDTLAHNNELIPAKSEWIAGLVNLLNYQQKNAIYQYMEWCLEEVLFSPEEEDRQAVSYWKKLAAK